MLQLGRINSLIVIKKVDFGFYLDGDDDYESVLLPKRYAPPNLKIDDTIDVFIYKDSEDRIIATTETPLAQVGEIALMKVKEMNHVGAFLEWGLSKDLLSPFHEQIKKMESDKEYLVHLYVDKSDRICASAKLNKFLSAVSEEGEYSENMEVDLLIEGKTDLGWNVIVDQKCWAIIYYDDVFQPLQYGMKLKGFVKKVRDDNKLDISLQKIGREKVDDIKDLILQKLKEQKGYLSLHDKSSPEDIKSQLGISKKAFKQTIGGLYRDRLINLEKGKGISLIFQD